MAKNDAVETRFRPVEFFYCPPYILQQSFWKEDSQAAVIRFSERQALQGYAKPTKRPCRDFRLFAVSEYRVKQC